LGLGVLAYLLCYLVLAGLVLHEPVVAGAMHGEALGFIDWAVLWMLWYVSFLGFYGPAALLRIGTRDTAEVPAAPAE
jgi:AAT family amino acid transporter